MTLSRTRLLASSTAAALLASSAMAVAADAPKVADADLVRISGGAQLRYDLSKATPTAKQSVTIAGKAAKVRRFDQDGARLYVATVHKGGFKAGRSYRVVLKANGRTLLNKSLELQPGR